MVFVELIVLKLSLRAQKESAMLEEIQPVFKVMTSQALGSFYNDLYFNMGYWIISKEAS